MKNQKTPSLFLSLLPIVLLIISALLSAVKWKCGMYVPLMAAIIVSCIVGKCIGIKWSQMEKSIVNGVSRALLAVFILTIVGSIIGAFIISGIIPTLIYYGLEIITPQFFIPAAALVTAIISTAAGSSFTSIATIGLALMAAGTAMGFPAPLIAGAVISGAYFGDKMSPLSDSSNVASAMSECTLFEYISHTMLSGLIALFSSIVIYYFIGLNFASASVVNSNSIGVLVNGLSSHFNINPILLLVPLVSIIFAVKKVPALPSLMGISLLGGFCAVIFQKVSLAAVFKAMTFGYESKTKIKILDDLLCRGGITSMGGTILLLITAAALGGILEEIGALNVILNSMKKIVNSDGGLISASLFSGLFISFATGSQILAIIMPARMFAPAFKERGLHTKNLSRAVSSVGAVGINLVPWSIPCIFAFNILGVEPLKFIPFIFFAYIDILLNLIIGWTGFTVTKINRDEVIEKQALSV